MRRSRIFLAGMTLLLALFFAVGSGHEVLALSEVKVRGGVHKTYARIVFDWPVPVTYTTDLSVDNLRIRFSKPFAANYAAVVRHLDKYVAGMVASEDGHAVDIKLLQPVRVRDRRIDGVLAFDLLADPKAAALKETTGNASSKAAAGSAGKASRARAALAQAALGTSERVLVRAGEHGKLSRLVFDWRRNVGYTVVLSEGGLSVAFARPAQFDLSELQKDPPRFILGAEAAMDRDGARVTVRTKVGVRFRHFRAGTKVVLDIYAEKKDPKGKKDGTAQTADRGENTDTRKTAVRAKTHPSGAGPARPVPDKSMLRAAQEHGVKDDIKLAAMAATGGPKSLLAGASRAPEETPGESQPAVADDAGEMHDVSIELDQKGEELRLLFAWEKPVPAAVFERSGYVWAVFGRRSNIDSRRLIGNDWISAANQIGNDNATVLRLKVRAGLFPVMQRRGRFWQLTLTPSRGGPNTLLSPVAQPFHKNGPRLFIPATDSARQVRLYDPEVGDEVYAIPMLDSGAGMPIHHSYVEFQLLATAQGLVIKAEIDDLIIRAAGRGVIATTKTGLVMSAVDPESVQAANTYSAAMKRPVMQLYEWRGGRAEDPKVFDDYRKALLFRLASAPKAGRNKARWELAKFYLGQGLFARAGGIMQLMEESDARASVDPQFRAARGLVGLLLDRLPEAALDLQNVDLRLFPDVALWRGSVLSRQGKYDEANRQFVQGVRALPDVPQAFRARLFEDWAVAAAAIDDKASLHSAAQKWRKMESGPRVTTVLEFLAGKAALQEKEYEKAEKHLRTAIEAGYRPYAARARLSLIDAEREQEKIDQDEAIGRYESLRFAWRGDSVELDLIGRTVDLELEKQDYAAAMGHLRDAVSHFPKTKTTLDMAERMKQTFVDLFLNGKADDLPAISALALYFDFKELTPLGKQGDAMIQRLADRLADVDLLDRAARLLEHQVRYRLRGAEKVKVQTRLAVIYLLDAMPEKALNILRDGETKNLSEALVAQRRYLQARALAELDKIDEALALLAADTSAPAKLLRAGIYWRGQRWANAAETTENLLGQRWRADDGLNPIEQSQVVQLAVSYYMAGDAKSLKGLNHRYGNKMADGPHAETFRVLTHKVDQSQTKFRDLAGQIARVADLEAFMASYRDKLKNGGLSALN
ncbi:MAG: hypothetical protein O2967_08005 [Proteobacteria bacterium]|nr:hypothetical protein [Pseudomonadota bacterium]